jgi:uncharacterized repeat protein (TIGR03803 family)
MPSKRGELNLESLMKTWIKKLLLLPALVAALGLMLTGRVTAQPFTILHIFTAPSGTFSTNSDGDHPQAGLVLSGNTLYGTAEQGGTAGYGAVFRVNTDGTDFTNLYSFTALSGVNATNSDGAYPQAGLILSGNVLYGTAPEGGSGGAGTVFAINTDGSGFTNLHTFAAASGINAHETNSDGAFPSARLLLSDNTLYGTTPEGGSGGSGTVFRLNTDGSGFTNLYSFTTAVPFININSDGYFPHSALVLSGNTLYGTAALGGSSGKGTVFAINTDGTDFTNLYTFTGGSDGGNPQAGFVLSGNTLYGTANGGSSPDVGSVFAINTDGSGFTNVYSFTALDEMGINNDGANPVAALFLSGNTLYGTAANGGNSGAGAVFAVNTDGSDFTNLYSFTALDENGINNDGASPEGSLLLSGSNLYGTAFSGGSSGAGTVFSLSLLPVSGQGLGLSSYAVFKTALYYQSDATPPVAVDPSGPYFFAVQYFAYTTNDITDGVTFITPDDVNYSFDASDVDYFAYNSDFFDTKDDMDAAFPDGLYLFSINQATNYNKLTLPANELYSSSIPAFSGDTWTNLQTLDATNDVTLNWNNFTPNPSANSVYIFVRILDVAANNFVFFDNFLSSGTMSADLPAYTLNSGVNYRIELIFSDRSDNPNGGLDGKTDATAGFENLTYFYFTTAAPILNIAPAGTNIVLNWPTTAANFNLQCTHDLSSGNWNTVTNPTSVIGNQIVLTNAICGSNTFFRLLQQQ